MRPRRHRFLLLLATALTTSCSECKNILQPDLPDSGLPDGLVACTSNAACSTDGSLVCAGGTCAAPGTQPPGAPCSAARDCAAGLTCTEAEVCAPAGTAPAGAACSTAADCAAGLACIHDGFGGTCSTPGTGDLGDTCNATANCIAGLACGADDKCDPVATAYPPYAGVACAPDTATFGTFFEVPRNHQPLADWYRLPFPTDVRVLADGTLDMAAFPRPGKSILGVDLVDLYATALSEDFAGFSTIAPVTFRFTSELDFASLGGGANLKLVDITNPASSIELPERSWDYDPNKHKLLCQHALVLAPSPAKPLLANHTYAAYLTTAIKGKVTGTAPIVPPDLTAMLASTAPSDTDLAAAYGKHAKFRAYLTAKSIDPATIANVAVFTVGDPTAKTRALATATTATAAPAITALTVCDGTAVSPCATDAARACGTPNADFYEIHGRFSEPYFQAGTIPYATVADGGAIPDVTTPQTTQDVCFALTIPKATAKPGTGWPLVVHAHGTGGNFRAAITDGIATKLATGAHPTATLTYDGVMHGARNNSATRSVDSLVFNAINPRAARDNHLQGAVDVIQALRIANTTFTASTIAISFDPVHTYFFGHSQGSNVGILGVAESTIAKGAVFSGAGSDLTIGILDKTSPVAAKAGLELLLGEPVGGGHPLMVIFQTFFDAIDPINHANLLVTSPPAGVPSKHVLQTWSATDTYAPESTLTITAQAAHLRQAAPNLEAIGGSTLDNRPITNTVTAGDGQKRIAHVFEYATDGTYDGHFVAQQNPQAIADWSAFFTTLVAGGSPNIP